MRTVANHAEPGLTVVVDLQESDQPFELLYPEIGDDGKRTGRISKPTVTAGEVATWAAQYAYQKEHGE